MEKELARSLNSEPQLATYYQFRVQMKIYNKKTTGKCTNIISIVLFIIIASKP